MTSSLESEERSELSEAGARELLSPTDAAWFRMGGDADIVSLMALEGEVDEARLRAVLEERLLRHPKFRMRVQESVGGVAPPRWEDEADFALHAHFTRCRIAAPGDARELTRLLVELVNRPMDADRSLWRAFLLDGAPEGAILVTQIHHCMADGFALVDLLLSVADPAEPAEGGEGTQERTPPSTQRSSASLAAGEIIRRIPHGLHDLGHLLLLPFDPPTRLRRKPEGARLLASSTGVPLARVKALAKGGNATVNDALLAALAGALRRYLMRHGDELHSFRALVPVNLRAPSEAYDDEHGNRFGLVFVDLPIELEDPEARLAAVKATVDRIKASEEAMVSLAVLNVVGRSPAVVGHVADELLARKATLVITNVPGPRHELMLAGRRIRDMMFWAPHPSGLSLGVSILSYAGTVRVGVRGDAAAVPDPELIAQLFDAELAAWEERAERAAPRGHER